MANLNPSYVSTADNVATTFADRTAISLPDLKKTVQMAFAATNVFAPRAMVQYVDSFSGRFPSSWKMGTPSYHTVGNRILGDTSPPGRNFRDITSDDRLYAHIFVDEQDANSRAMVNFLPMFGREMGQSIAQFDDQQTAVIALLAARASSNITGGDGGHVIQKASCDSNAGALNAAIWDLKNSMDEKNVPISGRTLVLRPAQYNLMLAVTDRLIHRELGQGGSIGANPMIPAYAGFSEILMSNNIPSTNIASSPTGTRNTYAGDFTKTVAAAFSYGAFGTVYSSNSLPMGGGSAPQYTGMDTTSTHNPVEVREIKIPDAFGTLYISSLITGHGILNPVQAGEIRTP